MSDDVPEHRSTLAATVLFAVVAVLIGSDLVLDYGEGASWRHLAIEFCVLLIASSGTLLLWRQLYRTRLDLADAIGEAEQWRRESRELVRGLAVAIERQFGSWRLSEAESEVGLLMLKGLSHKEIARLRRTSERTVREQARALYRKSGLSGRSSLSAFFLEDLLPPRDLEKENHGV